MAADGLLKEIAAAKRTRASDGIGDFATRPSDVTVPPFPVDLGGTPDADAAAHADAWTTVVAHLRQPRAQ